MGVVGGLDKMVINTADCLVHVLVSLARSRRPPVLPDVYCVPPYSSKFSLHTYLASSRRTPPSPALSCVAKALSSLRQPIYVNDSRDYIVVVKLDALSSSEPAPVAQHSKWSSPQVSLLQS